MANGHMRATWAQVNGLKRVRDIAPRRIMTARSQGGPFPFQEPMRDGQMESLEPKGQYIRARVALEGCAGELWALTPELLESGIYDLIRELMYHQKRAVS